MLSFRMHDMIAVFMVFEQSVIIMNSILSYSYTEQTQLDTTRQPTPPLRPAYNNRHKSVVKKSKCQ